MSNEAAEFLQEVADEAPRQWRERCPRGHANVTVYNDTYRCDSCEALYPGQPYSDDDGPFPLTDRPDPISEDSWETVLWAAKQILDNPTKTTVTSDRIATEMGVRKQQVARRIGDLRDMGFIEAVNAGNNGHRWQLTSKAKSWGWGSDGRGQLDPIQIAALIGVIAGTWLLTTALVVMLA